MQFPIFFYKKKNVFPRIICFHSMGLFPSFIRRMYFVVVVVVIAKIKISLKSIKNFDINVAKKYYYIF